MRLTSRLAELIEDWSALIGRDGILKAAPAIGLDLLRLPYRHLKFFIVERSLSDPLPDIKPKILLDIRPFQRTDIYLVKKIDLPSEARQCERRLELGHRGFIALYRDDMAGYAWGYTKISPLLERVQIELEPGDVLFSDMFTNPAFRGHGVQTALSLARLRLFRDLGFRRAICYIEVGNLPSLNVWTRKLGGLRIGKVDFLRIGSWYRVRFSEISEGVSQLIQKS